MSADKIHLIKCIFPPCASFFFIVICVYVAADILMAQELWDLMTSKGMIREEVLAYLTLTKNH